MTDRDTNSDRDNPVVSLDGQNNTPGIEQVTRSPIYQPDVERTMDGRPFATISFINTEYFASARNALHAIDMMTDCRRNEIRSRLENGFYGESAITREVAIRIVQTMK